MLPISDIIIRSISGYVFIVPILILYFLYLRKSGREQSLLHIAAVFVFCYYLFGILTVAGIGYTSTISFSPKISLIPFLGMICLLYTSPSPRDTERSRMPSSA